MKQELDVDEVTSDTVREIVSGMTSADAVEYLLGFGVPIARIYSVKELVKDPHLRDRGMFVEVEHPKAGKIKTTNFPAKFSETPGIVRSASPLLGQNNVEILTNLLGYTEEQVQRLEREGVIVSERTE